MALKIERLESLFKNSKSAQKKIFHAKIIRKIIISQINIQILKKHQKKALF